MITTKKEFIDAFFRDLAGQSQDVTVIKFVGAEICWRLELLIDLLRDRAVSKKEGIYGTKRNME